MQEQHNPDVDMKRLGQSQQAHQIYRAAEQSALAMKPQLSPEQWGSLLQALSVLAMSLLSIFSKQQTAAQSQSPRERSQGEGPVTHEADDQEQQNELRSGSGRAGDQARPGERPEAEPQRRTVGKGDLPERNTPQRGEPGPQDGTLRRE